MQAGKETASNVAASARAGLEKTKASLEEKAERMTTRDPLRKELATERKEERKTEAELEKQRAREYNAAQRQAGATGGILGGHPTGHTGYGGTTGYTSIPTDHTGYGDPMAYSGQPARERRDYWRYRTGAPDDSSGLTEDIGYGGITGMGAIPTDAAGYGAADIGDIGYGTGGTGTGRTQGEAETRGGLFSTTGYRATDPRYGAGGT